MEILAPIDSYEEMKLLIAAGATELYCGYVRKEWINKFGYNDNASGSTGKNTVMKISINKRTLITGQITSKDELIRMSKMAKSFGVKIYVTFNAFYYTNEIYDILLRHLEDVSKANVSGVIVTDVALIRFISNRYPKLKIVLSCCNQVSNEYASYFFENMGVKRITFPRHITINDMVQIAKMNSDMEYEAFVFDGRCVYDDGNCKPIHNFGHFCREQWDTEYYKDGENKALSYEETKRLIENEWLYKQWSRCFLSWKAVSNNGWGALSCGACAIPRFIECDNIKALKIAGRGLSAVAKIKIIRMVKKMLLIASKESSDEKEIELVKKTFGLPELCDNHSRCLMR